MAVTPTANWPNRRAPGVCADRSAHAREARGPYGGVHWREWLSELVGTAVLFGVGFSVVAALLSPRSPISASVAPIRFLLVGLNFGVLSALLALSPLGRRSGAHLNPAVTLAFWLRGDVHRHDLTGYLVAQFVGALLGTLVFDIALGSWATSIGHARTSPAPVGAPAGVAIEAGLTATLLVVFVALANMRTVRWTPTFVAGVLTLVIWVGSPPTGASLNPARSLAPALIERDATHLWVYFAGPAIGAVLAVGAVRLLMPERHVLSAKLFDDRRYPSTMRCRLPSVPPK